MILLRIIYWLVACLVVVLVFGLSARRKEVGARPLDKWFMNLARSRRDDRVEALGAIFKPLAAKNYEPVRKWIVDQLAWKVAAVRRRRSLVLISIATTFSMASVFSASNPTAYSTYSIDSSTCKPYPYTDGEAIIFALLGLGFTLCVYTVFRNVAPLGDVVTSGVYALEMCITDDGRGSTSVGSDIPVALERLAFQLDRHAQQQAGRLPGSEASRTFLEFTDTITRQVRSWQLKALAGTRSDRQNIARDILDLLKAVQLGHYEKLSDAYNAREVAAAPIPDHREDYRQVVMRAFENVLFAAVVIGCSVLMTSAGVTAVLILPVLGLALYGWIRRLQIPFHIPSLGRDASKEGADGSGGGRSDDKESTDE